MQIKQSYSSLTEGVKLCAENINKSHFSMQFKNRQYQSTLRNHCLRPEIVQNSHLSNLRMKNTDPNNIKMNDMNTTIVSINSNTILNSTAEQTDIQSFVETFLINSPNFSRLSPRPPLRSRQLGRVSRIDQLRQHNRIRERAAKTRCRSPNKRKKGGTRPTA